MKIKLFFILFIAIFLFRKNSSAQNYVLYGDKTFGGNYDELENQILYAGYNHIVLSGRTHTNVNGDKTDPLCDSTINDYDVWILKIDASFNITWNKSIGGSTAESLPQIITAGNNRTIFSCTSGSDSSCEKTENGRGGADYWICMIDSDGNKIWDKTYGSSSDDFNAIITQLSTGEFIVAGTTGPGISGDKTVNNYGGVDYWVVKLDSTGNKIWDKVYGGTGDETAGGGVNLHDFSLLACEAGGFIIEGRTNSPVSGDVSDAGQGNVDIWIIKVDSAGNKVWDRRYGGSSAQDRAEKIIHTSEGGYILVGTTDSPQGGDVSDPPLGSRDVWVIKLDSFGNKEWDKRYGGTSAESGVSIAVSPDGGYVVSANTYGPAGIDITEAPYGYFDYWIFKIDNAGNKIWDKRYGGKAGSSNWVSNFVIMPDSSIFLSGWADAGVSAVKTDSGKGGRDYWVVHFKYSDTATGINAFAHDEDLTATVFPNPTKDKVVITANSNAKAEVLIYDVMGQKIYDKKDVLPDHYEINLSGYGSGIYFLKRISSGKQYVNKIVKLQ